MKLTISLCVAVIATLFYQIAKAEQNAVVQECNFFSCKDTDINSLESCMKLAKEIPGKYRCKIQKDGVTVVLEYPK